MSPKFKETNGYVFKIYSLEEPRMHVHVFKAEKKAKYWLEPEIELAQNKGFSTKELSFIEETIEKYGDEFKVKYQRHIGQRADDQ